MSCTASSGHLISEPNIAAQHGGFDVVRCMAERRFDGRVLRLHVCRLAGVARSHAARDRLLRTAVLWIRPQP